MQSVLTDQTSLVQAGLMLDIVLLQGSGQSSSVYGSSYLASHLFSPTLQCLGTGNLPV